MGDTLAVFTCSRDVVNCKTLMSVLSLLNVDLKFNWAIQETSPIGRARSICASQFLRDMDIPYMLFVDSDMVFEKGVILGIIDSLKKGHDVVSALYPTHDEKQLVFSKLKGKDDSYPFNSLEEVRLVGMGLCGITRKILEKIKPTLEPVTEQEPEWYPFFEAHTKDGLFYGEDCDFCDKVRSVGGKVEIHTGLFAGHVKSYVATVGKAIEKIKEREKS